MRFRLSLALAVFVLLQSPLAAQNSPEWTDDLVEHMAGSWKITGQVLGHEAHHEVRAEWVLNHQFLRIHEKTAADAPKSEQPYEAIWFLGYDSVGERYVLHLMDILAGDFQRLSATASATATRFVSFSSIPTAHSIRPFAGIPRLARGIGS
jgi:hypothetical protein